jgi:hypothetical protein
VHGIEAWQGLGPRPSLQPVSDNPYQAPAVVEVAAESDAESTRRKYLNHEASVKGVGSLYLLGGVLGVLALLALFGGMALNGGSVPGGPELLMLVLSGAIGVLQLIAGLGLRKFSNRGRILGAVVAGISLIVIPIGTVIGAYILYLLLGAKGKMVFSPEYQEVIAQTPHIRYRTSKWVWILLILFLLFIVFLMFAQRTPTP